jgi:tetratricopeptide (TPR) repeat protein
MFTINIYLKFTLIALCLIGGIALSFIYGFWYAFPFLLIGIILLASYFLLGTVNSTAKLVQEMDIDGAEKRLGLTKFPNLLYVTNRAMYYIMKGTIATQKKDNKLAEEHFNSALALDLPTDNERGMVLLQLANINANKGNWKATKNYYREAQKLTITQQEIKDQIQMMGQALKQSGQNKVVSRMAGSRNKGMMMRPGGKRRRPKSR